MKVLRRYFTYSTYFLHKPEQHVKIKTHKIIHDKCINLECQEIFVLVNKQLVRTSKSSILKFLQYHFLVAFIPMLVQLKMEVLMTKRQRVLVSTNSIIALYRTLKQYGMIFI